MYFIPSGKLEKADDKASGAKYKEWEAEGYLRIVEGNDIDTAICAEYIAELYRTYGIKPLVAGYDQRYAKQFTNKMEDFAIDVEMVNQNAQTLSNPMKMLEADLIDKRLNYGNNPLTKWCLGNTAIRTDGYDKSIPVKAGKVASSRIDGTAALIDSYEVFNRHRKELQELNGF
jgi:phage terminase large subunit-like protein